MSEKQSLSDKTFQLIKGDIVSCVFAPGQQIAQAELAAHYQIGMTPVREALRRLAQEGFVDPIPRFGYVVSRVTVEDVHEIFETRRVLESASIQFAIERGQDGQLQQISKAADFTYTYRNHKSYSEFLARNKEFHLSIMRTTGNNRLVELLSRVLDELTRLFHLGLDLRDSADEMREDHLAIVDALCRRKTDLALELVQAEIARSQERVLEALKGSPARPKTLKQAFDIKHQKT